MESIAVTAGLAAYSAPEFRVHEIMTERAMPALRAVAHGKAPVVLLKGLVAGAQCSTIVKRFWASERRRLREDGVPGHVLGAYHYGKSFSDFAQDNRLHGPEIDGLFKEMTNPLMQVASLLTSAADLVKSPRAARWSEQQATFGRALSWTAGGNFLLAPHDDVSQMHHPAQADFEINTTEFSRVLALNFYPSMPEVGGSLRVWNVDPGRVPENIEHLAGLGYPYDVRWLDSISFLDVNPSVGDAIVMDARLVHAVTAVPDKFKSQRILINAFLGLTQSEILWWT